MISSHYFILFSVFSFFLFFIIYIMNFRKDKIEVSALFLWQKIKERSAGFPFLKRFFREKKFYIHFIILFILLYTIIDFSLKQSSLNKNNEYNKTVYRSGKVQDLTSGRNILLITNENKFLIKLLKQFKDFNLTVIHQEDYDTEIMRSGINDFDIVIYDRYIPAFDIGKNSLFINPYKSLKQTTRGDGYITPENLYCLREHPLMRYTDFSDFKISPTLSHIEGVTGNSKVKSFEGTVLLGLSDFPLILVSDHGDRKNIIINFNPEDSNFPESLNFPIFFINMLKWLNVDNRTSIVDSSIKKKISYLSDFTNLAIWNISGILVIILLIYDGLIRDKDHKN